MISISMSVHSVILFIPANRKCWIPLAGLTNSAVNTACKAFIGNLPELIKSAFNGRFFISSLVLFLCLLPLVSKAVETCGTSDYDQTVSVRHIIDGDTLVLQDGRKLRLIGIDTPELGYKRRPAESGALAAQSYLRALVKGKNRFRLKFGAEREDRHGRLLAHLFLQDGRNVQASLLQEGYAIALNVPPNVLFSDCYEEQMSLARAAKLGLWQLPEYRLIEAHTLRADSRGYRLVQGVVSRVGFSQSAVWLNLDKHLAIRIRRKDLPYLPLLDLENIVGTEVEVRGKLYQRNRQLRVNVRHGNDLKIKKQGDEIPLL